MVHERVMIISRSEKSRPQVFISCASHDRNVAQRIARAIRGAGIRVWLDELRAADSIIPTYEEAVRTSDYVVVLLSSSAVRSKWVQSELNAAMVQELSARDVRIIPVLIGNCKVPSILTSRLILDLRTDFKHGLDRLVAQLQSAINIDFSKLDPLKFEMLVEDLLHDIGFRRLATARSRVPDRGYDLRVIYPRKDPFGFEVEETWLVQIKFRQARADIKSLHQLAGSLANHDRALLITNGQLTSAAQRWLNSQEGKISSIRVVDGIELKGLLDKRPGLVRRYFGGGQS